MTREVRMTGYIFEDYGNIAVGSTAGEFDTNGANYLLVNAGADDVFVGSDNSVTVGNGFLLSTGDRLTVRNNVFLIAATTGDVRYAKIDK